MPKNTDTAREFILETLQTYPNNEVRVADLFVWCDSKFTKQNLVNTMLKLHAEGLVVRTSKGFEAWWAIKK